MAHYRGPLYTIIGGWLYALILISANRETILNARVDLAEHFVIADADGLIRSELWKAIKSAAVMIISDECYFMN